MTFSLFPAIATYFEVSNGQDATRLTDCFTADAAVLDEGHIHQGHDAIQAWMAGTRKTFEYSVTPSAVTQAGRRVIVVAEVIGNFPGSPVRLEHRFLMSGDRIQSLEIG
ncbi:nuclear transport factor 2 family protein [Chromohalobacter israelensis]|uniref:nuclear transport factor 2 family protein n=1 Tax=Chromohalobacter israelensis TaxID=141390 RepID=UPI00055425C7|nr:MULTISPECIES: nuclear transport factor 2 family protein [Chromohalobacter]MBZ5877433.1 nuclear transport factor 2 family protein [Chromohalobacter salexigens]MDF9436041.1 nuclear transport factor 2 family protein [Chromohalobacter israelensis]PWW34999.1 SnoaL-like protein [Chromohalobacter salexigens]